MTRLSPLRQTPRHRLSARLERLEDRLTPVVTLTPAQVTQAYGINDIMYGSTVGNGAGQTIAIIDPGDDATMVDTGNPGFAASPLGMFDAGNTLPAPPRFRVVGETGGARPTYPDPADNPVDPGETEGDVEWAHAVAPGANIVLIETTAALSAADIGDALTAAVPQVGASVVSMSFQFTSEASSNTSATEAGNTVTVTTTKNLYPLPGDAVTISGVGVAGYNGTFTITAVNGTSFTYTDPDSGLAAATDGAAEVHAVFTSSSLASPAGATEAGNTVTITTADDLYPAPGNTVTISGVGVAGYNGTFTITAVNGTSFTYTDPVSGLAAAAAGTAVVHAFDDGAFSAPGVAYVVSSGDDGTPTYPSVSPNVLAVGATNLVLNANDSYQSETGWSNPVIASATETGTVVTITTAADLTVGTQTIPARTNFQVGTTVTIAGVPVDGYNGRFTITAVSGDSFTYTDATSSGLAASNGGTATGNNSGGGGGGVSLEEQPTYQQGTVTQSSTNRTTPDVSFVGSESTPLRTYFSDGGFGPGYGTSVSAPAWAGLVAIADQGLALRGQPLLTTSMAQGATLQTALYQLPAADFHDITAGSIDGESAGPGYDLVTGLGTPVASLLIPALAGWPARQALYPDVVIGSDAGPVSSVAVYTGTVASPVATLTPFGGFTGGVRVAVGDFTGDGTTDYAVGTGPGAAGQVDIISGSTGQVLFSIRPFESGFTGGVFVAAGGINGDGRDDLVITPDQGGGPRVEVYEDVNGALTETANFFALGDPDFRGGARAAVGDIRSGTSHADLVVAAGYGGGPVIEVYDGQALSQGQQIVLVPDFSVFDPSLRNGVYVAVGDVNGDGYGDVIVGAGQGGGPEVMVLSGQMLLSQGAVAAENTPIAAYFDGDSSTRGGARVAVANLDDDQYADVIVGAGTGGTATTYSGAALAAGLITPKASFAPFPGFTGGVFVG